MLNLHPIVPTGGLPMESCSEFEFISNSSQLLYSGSPMQTEGKFRLLQDIIFVGVFSKTGSLSSKTHWTQRNNHS